MAQPQRRRDHGDQRGCKSAARQHRQAAAADHRQAQCRCHRYMQWIRGIDQTSCQVQITACQGEARMRLLGLRQPFTHARQLRSQGDGASQVLLDAGEASMIARALELDEMPFAGIGHGLRFAGPQPAAQGIPQGDDRGIAVLPLGGDG